MQRIKERFKTMKKKVSKKKGMTEGKRRQWGKRKIKSHRREIFDILWHSNIYLSALLFLFFIFDSDSAVNLN